MLAWKGGERRMKRELPPAQGKRQGLKRKELH